MRLPLELACAAVVVVSNSSLATQAADNARPGTVCHVKVLSDKVADVSSLEAWKKSFLNEKMSDSEKAIAIWKSAVTFTFDCSPPQEMLEDENCVRDPIKAFNVYGYGLCSDMAGQVEALARYAGFQARGWALQGHSVPEVFYENGWHLIDAAYIDYWPKADGKLAGIEEIAAEIKGFFDHHPDVRGDAKLREFSANNGWKQGPESMARCPTLDKNGICPEGYHGWWSFMQCFGRKKNVYEYGAAAGYELNIQLREGERLVRNWGHQSLYVNMDGVGGKPNLEPVGKGALAFSPAYGDRCAGRLGNGKLEYAVPLAQVSSSALSVDNLEFKGAALQVKDAARAGTGLESLAIHHDIQYSQRALPALGQGENRITFSAGPQEGTISYQASMDPANKGRQLVCEDLHPTLSGMTPDHLKVPTGKGEATFNIAAPGEMTRLRFGANWRARGVGDWYDVQVSFDQGKTFKSVRKLGGPTAGESAYFVFSEVPAGISSAQVKLVGKQVMRIDADYRQPNSGLRPVKITYDWEEDGQAKQDVHIAREAEEAYSIRCAGKPVMRSITLELAE